MGPAVPDLTGRDTMPDLSRSPSEIRSPGGCWVEAGVRAGMIERRNRACQGTRALADGADVCPMAGGPLREMALRVRGFVATGHAPPRSIPLLGGCKYRIYIEIARRGSALAAFLPHLPPMGVTARIPHPSPAGQKRESARWWDVHQSTVGGKPRWWSCSSKMMNPSSGR